MQSQMSLSPASCTVFRRALVVRLALIVRSLVPHRPAFVQVHTVPDDLGLALAGASLPAARGGHLGRAHQAAHRPLLERHRGRRGTLRLGGDAVRELAGHLDVLGPVDFVQFVAIDGGVGTHGRSPCGPCGSRNVDLVVRVPVAVPGGAIRRERRPRSALRVVHISVRLKSGVDEAD